MNRGLQIKRFACRFHGPPTDQLLLIESLVLPDLRLRIVLTYRPDPDRLAPYDFSARPALAVVPEMDTDDRYGVIATKVDSH